MSYSQLILSERPYGYWECSSTSNSTAEDLSGFNNDASILNVEVGKKPIIYGPENSFRLNDDSTISITNIYKSFFLGSENKSSSIDFFFSIKDSNTVNHQLLTIGSFLSCYVTSDRIFIRHGNKVASIRVRDWNSSQYVCIIYKNKSVSLNLNNELPVSINLGEEFAFPDSSPPDIVFGPSADPQLPIYLNSIAIYSYQLSPQQIFNRLSWAGYSGKSELLSIANNGEIINPLDNDTMYNFYINLSKEDNLKLGQIDNLTIKNKRLTLNEIAPAVISSTTSSLNYSIDLSGISFGDSTYIDINDISSKINLYSGIVRFQCKFDGLSTDQTILEFGPLLDESNIKFYKTSSNTLALSIISAEGVQSNVLESSDLGSDYSEYFDISLIMLNNKVKILYGENETSFYQISDLNSSAFFRVGNNLDLDEPLTSIIKNFCVSDFEDGETISYDEAGKYMLRFNNSLAVSQKGSWEYSLIFSEKSILSDIYFNFACKNIRVYINGARVFYPGLIPDMIYSSESYMDIKVEIETSDSVNELPYLSDLIIKTYSDCTISSNNGNYSIGPIPTENNAEYVTVAPFEIKNYQVSPLSRPDNLGIKFRRSIPIVPDLEEDLEAASWEYEVNLDTTGACLVINSDNVERNIKVLEFLIKLDDIPAEGEEFCIFDIPGDSISLRYDETGLVATSGFSMYVDASAYVPGTLLDQDELYYVAVVFDSSIGNDILLGTDSTGITGLNASMTGFSINSSEPSNFSQYLEYRLDSIKGRAYISKLDDQALNISDSSANPQEYSRSADDKYFAMKFIPKVKIIQNKWEIVK